VFATRHFEERSDEKSLFGAFLKRDFIAPKARNGAEVSLRLPAQAGSK
jgi:hypothetical protein